VGAVDDQRNVIGGLEGRLVEAGEGAARVGGFELGDGVVALGGFGEIKAAQLVVQDAGILYVQNGFARLQRVRKGEGGLRFLLVNGDFCRGHPGVCPGVSNDILEGDLGGVERDVVGGL